MSEKEFLQKREELERELNALRPIDYDNLLEAADLLANFRKYWDNCTNVEQREIAQQQLLAKIIARVFVFEGKVFALALHGDFSVILDKNEQTPAEVLGVVRSYFGDDGIRTRDLCLDRAIC